jgi:hypothetical protein
VHAHRAALRIEVIGLAVLVFLFLTPSGVAAIVIALVLVVCLGVIQFLDQPAQPGSPGGGRPTRASRTACARVTRFG